MKSLKPRHFFGRPIILIMACLTFDLIFCASGEESNEAKGLETFVSNVTRKAIDDDELFFKGQKNVVIRPKAKMCEGVDNTGNCTFFNREGNPYPKCQEVTKAVKTLTYFGTCVRLYNKHDCTNSSRAFYPGSTNKTIPPDVRSIGPCFKNELAPHFTTIEGPPDSPRFHKKSSSTGQLFIPDDVSIASVTPKKFTTRIPGKVGRPIVSYILGHNGRVEFLRVEMFGANFPDRFKSLLGDLNMTSTRTENEVRNAQDDVEYYKKMDNETGDEMGQFVPTLFGHQDLGYPTDLRKVFPQSKWNRVNQRIIERTVKGYLQTGEIDKAIEEVTKGQARWAMIYLNVFYPNSTTNRPSALNYFINYHYAFWEDYYLPN